MLNYNAHPQPASPPPRVTGQFLARCRLSKWQRARLAAHIIDGKLVVTDLTDKQIAALCGVSVTYAYAVNRKGARHKPDPAERLTRSWDLANPEQRVAFARAAGAERVFDVVAQAIG
jgi:hypothetical protein